MEFSITRKAVEKSYFEKLAYTIKTGVQVFLIVLHRLPKGQCF